MRSQELIDYINELNLLLIRNYDAEVGYKNATESISNEEVERFFLAQSEQRRLFSDQLRNQIIKLGGEPKKGTSLKADIHRVWMDFKALLSRNDEKAIITEAIRGEKNALSNYEDVINDKHTEKYPELYAMLKKQNQEISKTVERLKEMKESKLIV